MRNVVMFLKAVDKGFSKQFVEEGELYFNTISHFRGEETKDSNVGDSYENAKFACAGKVTISIQFEENLPILEMSDSVENFKVLDDAKACLYCLYSVFDTDNNIEKQFMEEFCERDIYAILEPKAFIELIYKKLSEHENVVKIGCGLVNYYSFDKEKDQEIQMLTCFDKRDKYAYQKECRFYVESKEDVPIVLKLGNISHLLKKMDPNSKQIIIKRL